MLIGFARNFCSPKVCSARPVTITESNFGSGTMALFTPPGGTARMISPSLIQAANFRTGSGRQGSKHTVRNDIQFAVLAADTT
jgi:hypothetical protein